MTKDCKGLPRHLFSCDLCLPLFRSESGELPSLRNWCVCVCVCVSVPVPVPLLPLSFPKPNQLNRESRARSGHFFNKATLHWLGQLPITMTGLPSSMSPPLVFPHKTNVQTENNDNKD